MSFYKVLIISIILLPACLTFSQEPQIVSYDINVKHDPALKQLIIHADISFANRNHAKEIILLFSSEALLQTIFSKFGNETDQLSYSREGTDTLVLNLPDDSTVTAVFDYVYPLDETDSLIILDRGNRWYPLIADNIAKTKLTIYVPPGYTAVAAGNLKTVDTLSEGKKYVYESSMPVFKVPLVIFINSYYMKSDILCTDKNISLYLIHPGDSALAKQIVSEACEQISFFEDKIGKYGYSEFKLLEVPGLEGSNLGSSIIMSGSENFEYFEKGYVEWLGLLTAVQWIGTAVFPKFLTKGFWFFSISLPHYLRLMYTREIKGEELFTKELIRSYDQFKKIAGSDNDIPILEVDFPTPETGIVLYGKGVYVFDRLHYQMGDDLWLAFVRELFSEYRGKIMTYENFMETLNKYDSDSNYRSSFERMLTQKGLVE